MQSSDGKLVIHAKHLQYIWDMALKREHKIQLCKVKAHSKGTSKLQELNKKADLLAKEAVAMDDTTIWSRPYMEKIPQCVITRSKTKMLKDESNLPDIVTLQSMDSEIQTLLTKGKYKSWTIYKGNNDLIMACNEEYDLPVIIMPTPLR